jgi:NAD(P)-dependent dehydrogenase (short-subunit alcohol dehydrogenase family)
MRAATRNELIYAEQVDLGSLHSIRTFATKWIDNTPPRRLDMVILCASTLQPRFVSPQETFDGVEACWGVNCLASTHLLSILSPAIRAQPADRDVRVLVATCGRSANRAGSLRALKDNMSPLPKGREFNASALARVILARQFQRHLDGFTRADKNPNNARVVLVDPGITRTPGTRRWLSGGTLWGLVLYLLLWPIAWLVLKSPEQGAQSFLYASMEAEFAVGPGGRYVRECREVHAPRNEEISDENVGDELWRFAEKQIGALEKQGAVKRALAKKEAEEKAKKGKHGKSEGKVLGEIKEEDEANGEAAPATATGKSDKKPGSRRNRKAA